MRKVGFIFLLLLITFGAYLLFKNTPTSKPGTVKNSHINSVSQEIEGESHSYIFVPYWTINSEISNIPYDTLIYFGIQADKTGINTDEGGYKNLQLFTTNSGNKTKLLTVRMLSTSENSDILKSESEQSAIIRDSIKTAKDYNFNGIVLDLEMQGLPFDTLIDRITKFEKKFAEEVKKNNLSFGTLLYGDTYYRVRPYNISELGKETDRVFIMAYDFSKSRGGPGPNFPLDQKDMYGYDFNQMVESFSKEVPRNKITVILGMFGYDWTVDSDGKTRGQAESMTTLQFERFLTRCSQENSCSSQNSSSGMKIIYKKDNADHVIWFETHESAKKKIDYLDLQNIHSIAWWAYSFF